MNQELTNFIKYCLGYIKLTRVRNLAAQQKASVRLPKEYFDLKGLLNGDTDGDLAELIKLETFYSYDPNKIPEDAKNQYAEEKQLANRIEEVYNKYKNDQFTKQTVLNFGYFEIAIPIVVEQSEELIDENLEAESSPSTRVDKYPLFSVPIRIEKEVRQQKEGAKYYIYFADVEIQVNLGILEEVLGEDLYYQLVEEIGKYEMDGKLALPIADPDVFIDVWHRVKEKLKLKEANFDEGSFQLEEIFISLSSRANYFLAEDLQKLAKLESEELIGCALSSWVDNDDLNIESDIPEEKDLYFPFNYDKYKLRVLSLINNKAAIVQGPPGTGKSETIANLLCHLAATGNRVLFVSQKAQALKVVKDRLKKLDVKYLFGYIPNLASAQLGEEDEIDGIGPQLAGLNAHIEKMGVKFHPRKRMVEYQGEDPVAEVALKGVVGEKDKLKNSFVRSIETQRRIWELHQKLKELEDFDITISDLSLFMENAENASWNEIKQLREQIAELTRVVEQFSRLPDREALDQRFKSLNLNKHNYSEILEVVRVDVSKTGYDRHSGLGRKVNNARRNIRLSKVRAKLPREIVDFIDGFLTKDISRNDAAGSLEVIRDYCSYYESIDRLDGLNNDLHNALHVCGVTSVEYDDMNQLIATAGNLETVKKNVATVQELKAELKDLDRPKLDPNDINEELAALEGSRRATIARYIQNIINKNILDKYGKAVTVRQVVQKLARAFGKSKRAFKTFDNLRKDPDNFNAILDLVPVWIMELDDASRIIPLENGIFDYVILDEASQCNIAYTLPAMFRAKHALFVGDSEQMRDNTVMFKSNKSFDELARRYQIPDDLQIKTTGFAVQSVLDIATLRGFKPVPLRYHYRSPQELIGFSNKYFYKPKGMDLIPLNNNYLTYKDTNRVMLVHYIKSDWSEEESDIANMAEAKAILELFKELREDERYSDKSVGILTFFNAQAACIRDLFEKAGYREDKDNYKVSIIEGIQGDEKDIILYSFVIRNIDQKNRYSPLTGEGGDIRGDINRGRVNVAFSRARLMVHCFVSLPYDQIPEKIWIKKYIVYAEEYGVVDVDSTEIQPFDSHFEEEFYQSARGALKRKYRIQNQVASCGFKIDFVVTDISSGKKLAIECDGPCHFKDELDEEYGIYIEDDEERQRVLEAAGWRFYRIRYSDWINDKFDRNKVFAEIKDGLVGKV